MTSPELAYDLIPPVAFPNMWWGTLLQYAVIADFRLNTPEYMPPVKTTTGLKWAKWKLQWTKGGFLGLNGGSNGPNWGFNWLNRGSI